MLNDIITRLLLLERPGMLEGLPMRLSNFLKPENVFLQDFVAKQEEGEKIFPEMLVILKKMQNRGEGGGGSSWSNILEEFS
jgi:hypothetical protein